LRPATPQGTVFTAAQGRAGAWKLLPGAPVHAFPDNVVSVWTGHYANGTTYADGAAYTPSTP
jgi:hypothetical protein